MSFGDYTALPGLSHSMLKSNGRVVTPTEKMTLGTMVHNYMLEPENYEQTVTAEAKALAMALIKSIGEKLWATMLKEVAVTADLTYNGLTMQYKGRCDAGIYGRLVVDAKIIHGGSIMDTMNFFGYPNQLTGYAMGMGAKSAMVISVNAAKAKGNRDKSKYIEKINVPLVYDWWKEKIINHGY